MTMQRRHFELIAETLRDTLENNACGEAQREMVRTTVENFARALKRTNPQFNESRFLRACGVEE